eukprot:750350-Hanusia_phi.AAC.3
MPQVRGVDQSNAQTAPGGGIESPAPQSVVCTCTIACGRAPRGSRGCGHPAETGQPLPRTLAFPHPCLSPCFILSPQHVPRLRFPVSHQSSLLISLLVHSSYRSPLLPLFASSLTLSPSRPFPPFPLS